MEVAVKVTLGDVTVYEGVQDNMQDAEDTAFWAMWFHLSRTLPYPSVESDATLDAYANGTIGELIADWPRRWRGTVSFN